MKPRTCITTALIVATVAVGCSKKSTPSSTKTGDGATPAPVSQSGDIAAHKTFGEDGEDGSPKLAVPATFADGEAAYQAGKYGEAKVIFEGYIDQRPKNPWGHYMLALSAWKTGDLPKAEQSFEQALALDPYHMKSLMNLSRLFIEQKRHDEAIERLTIAATVDAESVQVQRLLGRTYQAQGRTDDAIAAYERAIELNELDAWSMNNLGLLLFEAQKADEALPLFAKAAELKPEVAAFHNNLGMALEHTGRFRAAATAYREALAANPGYAKAKQNLARVEKVRTVEDAEPEVEATTASK